MAKGVDKLAEGLNAAKKFAAGYKTTTSNAVKKEYNIIKQAFVEGSKAYSKTARKTVTLSSNGAGELQKLYDKAASVVKEYKNIKTAGASEAKYVDLYHGTSSKAASAIRKGGIDLSESRPDLDFGKGFYTTRDEAQAIKWASRRPGGGEVLKFRVPESELNNLNGLKFNEPSSSWEQFVRQNRNVGDMHGYNYIEGPMLGNPGPFMNGSAPKAFGNQISFHGQNPVDMLIKYLQR